MTRTPSLGPTMLDLQAPRRGADDTRGNRDLLVALRAPVPPKRAGGHSHTRMLASASRAPHAMHQSAARFTNAGGARFDRQAVSRTSGAVKSPMPEKALPDRAPLGRGLLVRSAAAHLRCTGRSHSL